MSKNILILTGSPRKGGNTDKLAEAFAKGAQVNNHKVTIFNAATKDIQGCKACDTCWSKGHACSFTDGFTELEPLIEQADTLVFASPLYAYTFSAQIKSAIDRCYAYGSVKALRPATAKEAVLLVCGAGEKKVFSGIVETYKNILAYLNLRDSGVLIVPRVHAREDIMKTNALSQAEKLGQTI